jgi:hypothetical protein
VDWLSTSEDTIQSILIEKPHASVYGPDYPNDIVDPWHHQDYGPEIVPVNAALSSLFDGSSFGSLPYEESNLSTASDALENLTDQDALFSFVGHGWLGFSGLVFYTEAGVFEPDWGGHGSILSSTAGSGVFDGSIVNASVLEEDALQDLAFAALLACEPNTESPSLKDVLLLKGVDWVLFANDKVHYIALTHFHRLFWECVAGELIPGGTTVATYGGCEYYARTTAHTLTLAQQGQDAADSLFDLDSSSGANLTAKDLQVVPAHYGKRTN